MTLLRALMVEDNEDDALLIQDVLRRGGFDVRALRVETEEAMRKALAVAQWDIVLADYSLPSLSARETLGILRDVGRDIPAIVISGTVGEEVAIETLKLGAEDYLLKQNLQRLVPAVRQALGQTESRRQRRRLEQLQEIILENSPDLICTLDMAGRYLEASAAAEAVLGYEPAALAGIGFMALVHPDDQDVVGAQLQAVLEGHRCQDLETRLIHKSGETVHIVWSATLSRADGVVVAVGHDMTERKRKDEALRRSEEDVRRERMLLRSLIDSIPDNIFFKDRNFVFLGCNRTFQAYYDLPEDQLVGKTDFDLLPERWARYYRELDEQILASGQPLHSEEEMPDEQGNRAIFDTVRLPFHSPSGELLGILGVSRDITERKRQNEALRRSEEDIRRERAVLRSLIDSIPDLVFFKDWNFAFLGCNRAFEQHLGITERDLIGKTDFDLLPEQWARYYREKDEKLVASGRSQRIEEGIPGVDGRVGTFDTIKTPLYGQDGERLGLVGISRDISARKQMEEALREKTALFEAQVESSLAGILVTDTDGRMVIHNQRLNEMWQIPPRIADDPDGVERLDHASRLTRDPAGFAARVAWLTANPDEISHDEIEFADGRILTRYSAPVRDKEGHHYGRTWIHSDITEDRRREQRLREAEKLEAVGKFAAGIAHDFKNMLAVIRLNTELMAQDIAGPQDYAPDILHATARAQDLVDQILGFASQQHAAREPIDLREPVSEAISLLRSSLTRNISIEQRLPDLPVMTSGNATQLLRLVLNLGKNAIQAMDRQPAILAIDLEVGTVDDRFALQHAPLRAGPALKLTVRDTGPGMDRETIAHVFEPFFSTKGPEGSGLGLALVHSIVAQHEGAILVDSTLGVGTSFVVWLPMLAIPSAPDTPVLHGKRILVVDDEPGMATAIVRLLSGLGCTAEAHDDPLLARERIARDPAYFDLVVTDQDMPHLNGIDLAGAAWRLRPDLPLILMSADDRSGAFARASGFKAFLAKPFTLDRLKEACIAVFDRG